MAALEPEDPNIAHAQEHPSVRVNERQLFKFEGAKAALPLDQMRRYKQAYEMCSSKTNKIVPAEPGTSLIKVKLPVYVPNFRHKRAMRFEDFDLDDDVRSLWEKLDASACNKVFSAEEQFVQKSNQMFGLGALFLMQELQQLPPRQFSHINQNISGSDSSSDDDGGWTVSHKGKHK